MSDLVSNNYDKKEWVESFARFGYAAKGVVYILVGGLAVGAAIGAGGQTSGKRGAVQELLQQPFGQVMLGIVAVGLLGYVCWRFYDAIVDPEDHGSDTQGIFQRIGLAISGLTYLAFSIYCLYTVMGESSSGGSGGSGSSRQSLAAEAMSQPFGQWIVGIIGAIVIGKGLYQFYKGLAEKFNDKVNDQGVDRDIKKTYDIAGKVGYIARGVVLSLIGFFVVKAAVEAQPGNVKGTGGIFDFLQTTGGPWLMGLIALGLVGYGIFMIVKAKYRRIEIKNI